MDLAHNPIWWRSTYCLGYVSRNASKTFRMPMMAIVAAILLNDALPGVVIVIMQSGGKALEDYAFRRASSSLDALLARSPRIAHRRKGASIEVTTVPLLVLPDPRPLLPLADDVNPDDPELPPPEGVDEGDPVLLEEVE